MLWDAAWDQNNVIDGQMYSYYVAAILDGSNPTISPTTPGEATTGTSGEVTTSTPIPTTGVSDGKEESGVIVTVVKQHPLQGIQCPISATNTSTVGH